MLSNSGLNTDRLNPVFLSALQTAWCAETCWPPLRNHYSNDNPAKGQCLISTLAAWASRDFRDAVVPGLALSLGETTWHFRLMALTEPIDPTWQQFLDGTYFQGLPMGLPMRHRVVEDSIYNPPENADLRRRLGLLLRRMEESGYKIHYTAGEIIDRAEQHFSLGRRFLPDSLCP
jgi:hypothetical protein